MSLSQVLLVIAHMRTTLMYPSITSDVEYSKR